MSKTAAVLVGGGAKGSFEAGVLKQLNTAGVKFDALYGTSTGALNAAGYSFIGIDDLINVWKSIKSINDIMIRRPLILLPITLFLMKQKGVYSMTPLKNKIDILFPDKVILNSQIEAIVCRLSLKTSLKNYLSSKDMSAPNPFENFRQAILGSASTPVMNDIVGGEWVDGGVRQIAPLSKAIKDGVTDIYVIQGETFTPSDGGDSNIGNAIDVFWDMISAMVQEMLWDDVHQCALYNERSIGQHINIKVYAPSVSLIGSDQFDPTLISESISQGLEASPVFTA